MAESRALAPLEFPEPIAKPVDPTTEYVAGGDTLRGGMFLRTLPHWIDDLTRDFDDGIYERMLLDPAVNAAVTLIKVAVLSDDVSLLPAVDDADPAYKRASRLKDACQRAFDRLEDPLPDTLFEMLDALAFGHKVAEIVYQPGSGQDSGRLVLKALKIKSRKATAFVVDPYMNVVGLLGVLPGRAGLPISMGMVSPDTPPINLLPRDKFAILSHRPSDGDPRGISILRPAYNAWWIKVQQWPEYLKFLAQFGTPSLIGIGAEGMASRVPVYNDAGELETDNSGNPVYLTPEQAFRNALLDFHNSTVIAVPHGADVKTIEPKGAAGSGQAFQKAIDTLNREITLAILCQTLATGEAKFGTRAQAAVHQDVLGLVIRHAKRALCEMIRRDILTPLVRMNFGERALALVPKVGLGDTQQEDRGSLMNAIAQLERSGFLTDSQRPRIDAMLNLPVREPDEVTTTAQPTDQTPRPGALDKAEQDGEGGGQETDDAR